MNSKEKKELKAKISQYIDLSNGHFTDDEILKLNDLVDNSALYDGKSTSKSRSYNDFDLHDRYYVKEVETLTIHCSPTIYIEYEDVRDYDDGQHNVMRQEYTTAREILRYIDEII